MKLLNSNSNINSYRYGYQGEYAEDETGEDGIKANSFQLRLYNPRLGRWMSPDPYGQYHSPYLAMGNSPIGMVDPDGGYSKFGASWRAFFRGGEAVSNGDGVWGVKFDDGFDANGFAQWSTDFGEDAGSGTMVEQASAGAIGIGIQTQSENGTKGVPGIGFWNFFLISTPAGTGSTTQHLRTEDIVIPDTDIITVDQIEGVNTLPAFFDVAPDVSDWSGSKVHSVTDKEAAQRENQDSKMHRSKGSKAKKQKHTNPRAGKVTGRGRNNKRGGSNKKFKPKPNPNKY